ncbi:MAG TPA: HD-GYP domain-containing protein [Sphingobium sp.]|nr:HD-GYP domain-containing protein [Sphingobium sp.]
MLKHIDVTDVRLGMFIHKVEGSWLNHPFWRTKFLLTDADLLAELRTSDVDGVVIDVTKGADVQPAGGVTPLRRPLVTTQTPSFAGAVERARRERMDAATLVRPATANVVPFDPRSLTPLETAREVSNARTVLAKANRLLSAVFEQARLGKAISRGQVEPVIEDLFASVQRNPHAFNGLMRIRRENSSLYAHGLAVSALMVALGTQMGLSEEQVKDAGMAGLLMDVGMGHLPIDVSTILEDLSDAQRTIMHTHTTLGQEFLDLGGELPAVVMQVCLEHHERYDGSGYPRGLAGEDISLFARMAAICDVYDSMTSDRPHRPRTDPNAALAIMRGMEGQFDEALLDQFIESVGVYPIGSVVRLNTSQLALVVDQNIDDYTRPRVWTFYDVSARQIIKPEDIDLALHRGRVEIVSGGDVTDYDIPNFPQLREMVFNSACKALY